MVTSMAKEREGANETNIDSNNCVSGKASNDKQHCTARINSFSHVPAHLQVRVLHEDESIVVIHKPSHLRSVPGHASPPPPDQKLRASRKRPRSDDQSPEVQQDDDSRRRTAQEAWVMAIRSFENCTETNGKSKTNNTSEKLIQRILTNLAKTNNLSSIPRKWKVFWRYVQRSRHRLVGDSDREIDEITAKQVYKRIEERQRPLLNLPECTPHEESAWGQLVLMGYSNQEETKRSCDKQGLFVVHRLDCETSGVMVFARTEQAASILSKAWRERDEVSKMYLALVSSWPSYENEQLTEGCIKLPLAPSKERIKWEVCNTGKPSTTKWKVRKATSNGIVLELIPVTGRTHQLRIHCAAVGSGICGDSLYGTHPVEWKEGNDSHGTGLKLHAHRLSFPHPMTGEVVDFVAEPPFAA